MHRVPLRDGALRLHTRDTRCDSDTGSVSLTDFALPSTLALGAYPEDTQPSPFPAHITVMSERPREEYE